MSNQLTKEEADALASLLRQINDREIEDAITPISLTVDRAKIILSMLLNRKII